MHIKSSILFTLYFLFQSAHADVLWSGDFETKDTSQYHYFLNSHGHKVVENSGDSGGYYLKIDLYGDESFWWGGNSNLNRSEIQYKPSLQSVSTGKDTFLRYRFQFPEKLPNKPHVISYWETEGSFLQIFRLEAIGSGVTLHNSLAKKKLWFIPGGAKEKVWHRVAMHVHWHDDPELGFVQMWFDGQPSERFAMKTLPKNGDEVFFNMGLLRLADKWPVSILLDDSAAFDNLNDLLTYN